MNKEEFVSTFLEGAGLADNKGLTYTLVGMVYDLRKTVKDLKEHISYMDDVAGDSGFTMQCRSCQKSYQPDCELSEVSHEGNYCGGSERCCP